MGSSLVGVMGRQGPAGLASSVDTARGVFCLGSLHFHDREYIGKGVKELAAFQLHFLAGHSECAGVAVSLRVIWSPRTCFLGLLLEP